MKFLKKEKLIKNVKDLQVVIMAGGKGKRLKPFTNILPKPLLPIQDKTAIEHIIDNYKAIGIDNFIITIFDKSEIIKSFFKEIQPSYKIKFVVEPKPLGTIGGLKLIKNFIKKNILVTNCDILTNFDILDFIIFTKIIILILQLLHQRRDLMVYVKFQKVVS